MPESQKGLSRREILEALPPEKRAELLELTSALEAATRAERASTNFMEFVHSQWPQFIGGAHHTIMAEAFDRVLNGECKRLIINMAPRHTKSEFASWLLPSYFLGRNPKKQVMQVSHTAKLAEVFGRKVRNTFQDKSFREIFTGVSLAPDSTAAGRWNTNQKGVYNAVGVSGAIAGKGADLLIIDDPHTEAEALTAEGGDQSVYDKVYDWFHLVRQRLQPGAAIIIVMTRWSQRDLTGQILRDAEKRGKRDEWEVIEFPAILPDGRPLWPQFWPIKELESLRSELPIHRWAAQYQQSPTSSGAALVKREWWREWDKKERGGLPNFEYIIQSWDTAFSTSNRADFSVCTTWGMFNMKSRDGTTYPQFMLLECYRERLEFPDLKAKAKELYMKHKPDSCIVEAAATGMPLIYELRQMGVPVSDFLPDRRKHDKILRVNAVSDIFSSGQVWYLSSEETEHVIDEFEAFPVGEHDDCVDSSVQAILRARQGGILKLEHDDGGFGSSKKKQTSRFYSVF